MKLYMFRTVRLPSSGVYSLLTHQWYMSYRFVESFRTGAVKNCTAILVLFQSCMTYTIAEYTVNCPKHVVSFQNKFVKLVQLVDFIIKKCVTMHVTSHERKTKQTTSLYNIVSNCSAAVTATCHPVNQ
jgi:hypothetical protein